jgi:hypothetical protein
MRRAWHRIPSVRSFGPNSTLRLTRSQMKRTIEGHDRIRITAWMCGFAIVDE